MKLKLVKSMLFTSVFAASMAMADTGILKVKVLDENNNPVVGANIIAQSDDSLGVKTAITDNNGEAKLINLDPASNYAVTVRREGYQSVRNENVLVVSGKSFSLQYTIVS